MVSHREGTCKDGTSFAVFLLTVAEEERVGSRIPVSQCASLSDIDTRDGGAVFDMRTILHDKVLGNHAVADVYR